MQQLMRDTTNFHFSKRLKGIYKLFSNYDNGYKMEEN